MQQTCHEVLRKPVIRTTRSEGSMELEKIRAQRRVFHFAQALPERRFLFGHHLEGDRLPNSMLPFCLRLLVRWLDQPVE